ncbi:hypothetical protein M0Q50_07940 [bacterium]|jgi:hypothetical protein|nr:hypothetical protein [bacterium]
MKIGDQLICKKETKGFTLNKSYKIDYFDGNDGIYYINGDDMDVFEYSFDEKTIKKYFDTKSAIRKLKLQSL